MLGALIRKQFAELGGIYFRDKKTGNKRSGGALVGFVLIYLALFVLIGFSFGFIAYQTGSSLINTQFEWLYFAIFGLMSMSMSVIINSLSASSLLFATKDNEKLLSMPIPPSKILFSRVASIFSLGFAYEMMIMIPVMIVYWILTSEMTVMKVLIPLLLMVIAAFFINALTALLGWVIAIITAKLKNKSIITVIVSLVFIAVLYYFQMRMNSMLTYLAENADKVSSALRTYVALIYRFGLGMAGDMLSVLIFAVVSFASFALVYYILSISFIRIATTNRGEKKIAYKEKAVKAGTAPSALLGKEFAHFLKSPIYMLNCGLGVIVIPALSIFLLIESGTIKATLSQSFEAPIGDISGIIAVLLTAIICLIISLNGITAPSISLEGKNIWILKSLPVNTWDILKAKRKMHLYINIPVVLVSTVIAGIALSIDVLTICLMCICTTLFVFLTSALGLSANLLKYNLDWANETVPVKQGTSVAVVIFGGFIMSLIIGGVYFLMHGSMNINLYLLAIIILLAALVYLLNHWLKTKGCLRFENI